MQQHHSGVPCRELSDQYVFLPCLRPAADCDDPPNSNASRRVLSLRKVGKEATTVLYERVGRKTDTADHAAEGISSEHTSRRRSRSRPDAAHHTGFCYRSERRKQESIQCPCANWRKTWRLHCWHPRRCWPYDPSRALRATRSTEAPTGLLSRLCELFLQCDL